MQSEASNQFNMTDTFDDDTNNELSQLFYLSIGSTWTFDSVYLFFVSPMAFISFILNLFCIYVVNKIKLKSNNHKNLYTYFKINLINSSVLSFIVIFSFISYSPRYFQFALSYLARIYRCHIANSVATTLYFYSNIFDLIITFERLSIFMHRLDFFKRKSPFKISMLTLFVCTLVNSPIFFWNYVKTDEEFYQGAFDLVNIDYFTYCGRTNFVESHLGSILSMVTLFLRDITTLLIEISINVFTIIYYYKYVSKRINLNTFNMANGGNNSDNDAIWIEIRLFFMTIILSFISLLCHILTCFTTFMLINHDINSTFIYLMILISILVVTFKQFINFFVFFLFNSNFKNALTRTF